ncbi:MAG: ATP-binding protein [Candidatus Electrothrix sp. ATG2]|nr:ATP-binding protein [Candidatus Electrothrix sp. ATG2]
MGKDDGIYIRFNNKAQELELRDELSPQLFSFIEPPENEKIVQLIKAGEKDEVEFKEFAYLNRHTGKEDKKMRQKISNELAALMNTHPEGTLLIGVDDSGKVVGIEREYKTANPKKGNWDGYHLALSDSLNTLMEKGNIHDFYKISECKIDGKKVCCIYTQKVDSPVLVQDKLFIRVSTQCKQLKGDEKIKFIQKFNQP